MQDVAAPAYGALLLQAASMLGPSESYFGLWPLGSLASPWSALADALYIEVSFLATFVLLIVTVLLLFRWCLNF